MTYIEAIKNFVGLLLSGIFVMKLWLTKIDDRRPPRIDMLEESSTTEQSIIRVDAAAAADNKLAAASSEENMLPNVVQSPLYSRVVRRLREKEQIIDVLNRRLDFLNGVIKLKDLRIANLVDQVLTNFVEIGLQRTRPYVTGSMQPRFKEKMPTTTYSPIQN